MSATGTIAQRQLHESGFLIFSLLGGMISSASTTATAATLAAEGKISPSTAGIGVVLTSIASALVNMPLVYQTTRQRPLTKHLAVITTVISILGLMVLWIVVAMGVT